MLVEVHVGNEIITTTISEKTDKVKFEASLRKNMNLTREQIKVHYIDERLVTIPPTRTMVRERTYLDVARETKLQREIKDVCGTEKTIMSRHVLLRNDEVSQKVKKLQESTRINNEAEKRRKEKEKRIGKVEVQVEVKQPQYRLLTEEERKEQERHIQEWRLEQAKKEKLEVLLDRVISNTK